MRILIDSQAFMMQRYGGISRFYTELYLDLKKRSRVYFPDYYSENIHLRNYKIENFRSYIFLKYNLFQKRFSKGILIKKNKWKTIELLKNGKIDVFVPTYYDTYFLDHLNGVPYVLTVYDMIHELFPQYFSVDKVTIPNKELLIKNAAKIIAISENTKKDILRFYPSIDSSKIDVVYLSHSISNSKYNSLDFKVDHKKYVLFVGNRLRYKNFIWFITSIANWLIDEEIKLICLGESFSLDELDLIKNLNLTNCVFQFEAKDSELFSFYKNALAFVFPSAYEGFGIPVLEAMSCGCPVVLPRASSFPEVASDAGVYFELDNPTSLIQALNDIIYNNEFREEIIRKGFINENKFSWKKTSMDCLKIYQSVIK
jgi:glycosyltransferase involved in cell wall biosynthesis